MAAARQGLPVRVDRAPQRGAAFAITRASRRARTRSIGSRSRARGSSLIFYHPPASAPPSGEFDKTPPFDIVDDTLFVAYSAWAEMMCFTVLGWKFPTHIFDQHTAYLAASNILLPYNPDEVRKRPRKGLADACRAYGIEGCGSASTRRTSPRQSVRQIQPAGDCQLLRRRRAHVDRPAARAITPILRSAWLHATTRR